MSSVRKFDIVLLGASGYTGRLVAGHMVKTFPTNLKWAIAGRFMDSLASLHDEPTALNADRKPPEIQILELVRTDLDRLTLNTCVLINVIGPYHRLSSPVLAACARNGTCYVDCTTETLWIQDMIGKYETAAIDSGAVIIPAISLSSSPSDLVAWLVATCIREQGFEGTFEVISSSKLALNGMSGGSFASVLALREAYGSSWFLWGNSWILSSKSAPPSTLPWTTWLVGYRNVPNLGILTTSFVGPGNEAVVHRSYDLNPSLYGPYFKFREYVPAASILDAVTLHTLTWIGTILLALPLVRWLLGKLAIPQGTGPIVEESRKFESVDFKAVGFVEGEDAPRAMATFAYKSSTYEISAVLAAEAAGVLLKRVKAAEIEGRDLTGIGGILTPSSLGMPFVMRMREVGVVIEVEKL
ncbi:hypothetical protein BKA64DRAFT_705903 [Cadophora sp. MPI-SDFR-AT-0126]|nr:hypothetical protein BKA64DRAFT_705903 [Leotiomycetes sp. MPI-SDFR-AT-0126]